MSIQSIRMALAGNPNSGKTTLFNALTGANQFVGNWPGVTIEKKEGKLKNHRDAVVMDLPGVYSLSPHTPEERIARDYLVTERPDVILNIVDGTNLERNLYLTTQLAELGIPMVVAVNMADMLRKRGEQIDATRLAEELGCPVVEISALMGTGVAEVAQVALTLAEAGEAMTPRHVFTDGVERVMKRLEEVTEEIVPAEQQRWFAIKLFERDEKATDKLALSRESKARVEREIQGCEVEMDDDAGSIVANERYRYISSIIGGFRWNKEDGKLSVSDRIDRVVTNRLLALPIFAAVMFIIYYVSITTVGTWALDWTGETLFGGIISPVVENFFVSIGVADWLQDLVTDGIIAGVGAVLSFVPQLFVLFAFLTFLEGCGYMARVAFIMDRIFRKFGLSGKSFIPMIIGTGCSVPGIMASRTIENDRDRKMTIMLTSFIPCGAKLPIIGLMAGTLFGGAWWVAPSAYFIGIAAVACSGILLKKTRLFAGDPAPFIMELPAYHRPTLGSVLRGMWERGWSFIKKAGTIILLSVMVIWFLQNFGFTDGKFGRVEDLKDGLLSAFGHVIAPIFVPLGWGHWEAAVAAMTGLVAKENVVGTFGVLYGYVELAEWGGLSANFTALSAYSFLTFNLLCAPCFAAIGAIRREMNNSRWTWFAVGYQTVFAYAVSLCVYQIGSLIVGNDFAPEMAVALALVAGFLYFLFRPGRKSRAPFHDFTMSVKERG